MKVIVFCISLLAVVSSSFSEEYQPVLFKSLKLIYKDDFSSGKFNTKFWQKRQNSTWVVENGHLVGSPSPKEYQAKKIAEADKGHAGLKPVVWLEKVPENLVVQFRLRYDAEKYPPKFPLIDVGHHINSLTFGEKTTKLVLKKNKKTIKINEGFLPLNQWVDVTIECKKGTLLLKVDDHEMKFEHPLIDMIDQHQIDFKGVDYGGISIDSVAVYEGIE